MVNVGQKNKLLTAILPALALATPAALAVTTGISPLDTGIETIARLFNISALQNETVAVGFAKFAWFLVAFALYNYGGKKIFSDSKRTYNTIAFVLAFITAFFMPVEVLMTASQLYASIFWIFIFTLPPILALYFGFRDQGQESMGLRLLKFSIVIIGTIYAGAVIGSLSGYVESTYQNIGGFVDAVATYMYIIMLLASIWKFITLFGGEGVGNLFSGLRGNTASTNNNRSNSRSNNGSRVNNTNPAPGPVTNAQHAWNDQQSRVVITWQPRPEDEQVSHYEVRRRAAKGQRWNPNLFGGWATIGQTRETTMYDTGAEVRAAFNPRNLTYRQNQELKPGYLYEYQVRAVNAQGRGPWTPTVPAAAPPEPNTPPAPEPDAPTTPEPHTPPAPEPDNLPSTSPDATDPEESTPPNPQSTPEKTPGAEPQPTPSSPPIRPSPRQPPSRTPRGLDKEGIEEHYTGPGNWPEQHSVSLPIPQPQEIHDVKEIIEDLTHIEDTLEEEPETSGRWSNQRIGHWHKRMMKAITDMLEHDGPDGWAANTYSHSLDELMRTDKAKGIIITHFAKNPFEMERMYEALKSQGLEVTWGDIGSAIQEFVRFLESEVKKLGDT